MNTEAMKLALEALMRSRKAVSGDLDLAGCAYGSNDPDGHRYDDAKKALVTLDKAITALREALAEQSNLKQVIELYDSPDQPAQQEPVNQRAHEMALRQWDHWKQYALELQEKLVKYEGGAPMVLNTSPPPQRTWVEVDQVKWHDEKGLIAKLKEKNT